MASVNKVILIGNLGNDPDIRYLPSGEAVANVSIATTDSWKDKSGEKQERTEWHRVSFFSKLAEIVGQYLKKGSSVYIEGRLQTRKFQDKDGNERQVTEIVADKMQMLGGKGDSSEGQTSRREPANKPENKHANKPVGNGFDDLEDDIPF